jgi:predicted nucleic-acid-binding protein
MTKYLIDTNFLARILIKDNEKQLGFILNFIDQAIDKSWYLFVDKSVIFELVYVLSGNVYQLPRLEVKQKIQALLDLECFTFDELELLLKSLELYEAYNLDIVDCYLISKAIVENYELQTFDQKAGKVFKQLQSK